MFFCTQLLLRQTVAVASAKKSMTRVLAAAKKMTRVPIVEAKKATAKKALFRVWEQLRKCGEGPQNC